MPTKFSEWYGKLMEMRRVNALLQHHDAITGTARQGVVINYLNALVMLSWFSFLLFNFVFSSFCFIIEKPNCCSVHFHVFNLSCGSVLLCTWYENLIFIICGLNIYCCFFRWALFVNIWDVKCCQQKTSCHPPRHSHVCDTLVYNLKT